MSRPSTPTTDRRDPRSPRRRNAVTTVVIAAAAICAGAAASQSSTAFWNDAETTEALTVTAGTAALSLDVTEQRTPELAPGATIEGSTYALQNTGDVPLRVTLALSASSENLLTAATTLHAWFTVDDCAGLVYADVQALVPNGAGFAFGDLEPGESGVLCTELTLASTASSASSGQTFPSLTLTIDGAQTR